MAFQSWKGHFKTVVCSKTAGPHLTMHWIKEVEMAKSIDEPMTSRSIVGRTDFTDFNMLDIDGTRKILVSLFMRSIRSSNLNCFWYNKQIDGDQAQKDRISLYGEFGKRKSCKRLPRNRRIEKNLLRRKQIEQDKQKLMNCLCIK